MTEHEWIRWIKSTPKGLTGLLALVAGLISFVVLLRTEYKLAAVVVALGLFVVLFWLCLWIRFATTKPAAPGLVGEPRFESP